MSQVRKLLNGNKIPIAQQGYKLRLDSQEYNVTDDQLKLIENELSNLDPNLRRFLGNWTTGIKSGNGYIDRVPNTVWEGMIDGVGDSDMKRLKEQKPNKWEAIAGKDSYYAKQAINAASKITYDILNAPTSTTNNSSKTKLSLDKRDLDFNTDSEGRKYLGPTNGWAKTRIEQILDHLSSGDNSTYDASDLDFSDINSWLDSLNDADKYGAAKTYFADLWERMKNPGFDTADDYKGQDVADILRLFNINIDGSNNSEIPVTSAAIKSALEKDLPGVYDIIGDNFTKDKYGIWRLNPGATFDFGIPELVGRNIYFNDDFFEKYPHLHLDPLRGLTYYNGALYKKDSPELAQILNREGGYNELVRKGLFDEADDEILTRFTEGNRQNLAALDTNNAYHWFVNNPEYRYRTLTGAIKPMNYDMKPGDELIQFINLANPDEDGPYKTYGYKFALLPGDHGEPIFFTRDQLSEISGATPSGLQAKPKVNSPGSKAHGFIYTDPTGSEGEPSEVRLYEDPNDSSNAILHIPEIYATNTEGKDLILPKELAKILTDTQNTWLPLVLEDPERRNDFEELMSTLVQSWWRRADSYGVFGRDWFGIGDRARRQFKRLGFSDDDLAKVLSAWNKAKKGSRSKRRSQYLTSAPTFNKDGGKIGYIAKLATGGFTNSSDKTDLVSTVKYDVTVNNPKNARSLSEISDFGPADWADLTALAADLASLGITIADPTNIAGMATGVASSLARYSADKERHTKGAGAQLALNLGMDAVTLLPVLGDAANAGKVARGIRRALPTIIKLASVAGISQAAINSAKKIANGEKFTVRDLSLVANAITSGVALAKTGGFGKQEKTIKTKGAIADQKITVGTGEGATEIKLKGTDLANISGKTDARTQLTKLIEKNLPDGVTKTNEEISNAVDSLMSKNVFQKVFNRDSQRFNAKRLPKTQETKTVEANGNWLHDWWYGVGDSRIGYLAKLRGAQPDANGRLVDPRRNLFKTVERTTKVPGLVQRYVADMDDSGTQIVPGLVDEIVQGIGRNPIRVKGYQSGIVAPQIFTNHKLLSGNEYVELPGTYKPFYKSGGVIKAQAGTSGIGFDYRQRMLDDMANKNQPWYPKDPLGIKDFSLSFTPRQNTTFNPDWQPTKPDWWVGEWNPQKTITSDTTQSGDQSDSVGGMTSPVPNYTKFLLPALSGIRFAVNSHFQNKYRDQAKAMVNAARYDEQAPVLNTYRTDNPALDRQLQQIQSERMLGVKPVTSDVVTNNAIQNQREAQLYDRERDIVNQRSQFDWNAQKENTGIENQNIINAVQTANSNRARTASINSALKQQDMEHTLRRGQSWENLGLEIQNNIKKDLDYVNSYNRSQYAEELQKQYDTEFDSKFKGARAQYNNLSATEAAKYTDLEDYVRTTRPDEWAKYANTLTEKQKYLAGLMNDWIYANALNYRYPDWLLGRNAPTDANKYKKGGRLNGTTRYKLEPDEQIWVDNNKATHAAIAKLSDNTIKLLLRSLK